MIEMSEEQAFTPKIEAQLLEINDTDTAIGKARVLLIFKFDLPQSVCSSMLADMTDRNDNTSYTEQPYNTKPNTLHFIKLFAKLE